jgi:uncharacterized protein (DUF433 family)
MGKDNWEDRISNDREILGGRPAIKGTRIGVEFVLGVLGDGWTEAEVLENYPHLKREDILACLKYAQALLEEMEFYPLQEMRAASNTR